MTTATLMVGVAGWVGIAATSSSAADTPPPAEEDYSYPGAAEIEKQHGIKLFRGDGHILFVTSVDLNQQQCAPGQVQVEKHLDDPPYLKGFCFKTTGTKGWLTLEVPATFGVRG